MGGCTRPSSGACECNWVTYDFIHSERRNRLSTSLCKDLVYVHTNSQLLRQANSEAGKRKRQQLERDAAIAWECIHDSDHEADDEAEEAEEAATQMQGEMRVQFVE